MKNFYVISLILCLTIGINLSANNHTKKFKISKEQLEQTKPQRSKSTQKASKVKAVSVLSEDFSKFTKGTETEPDTIDVTDEETGGIPESLTQVSGWSGYGVFQAGGAAYLGIVPYEEGDDTGYLDTPAKDLTANDSTFTVKFKAKSENPEGDIFVVVWYDNSNTDNVGAQPIEISGDWEDYTVEFANVGVAQTIVEFYAFSDGVFIDDVNVLSGSLRLSTPVATDATNLLSNGFTANWNAVEDATEYAIVVYQKEEVPNVANDLFISEYVEGGSNNRAIEIFNGTGQAVDLSQYSLKQAVNGGGWDKDQSYTLPLSGTLENNKTYVIANSAAAAGTLAKADLKIVYSATTIGGRVLSFTGDDAIGLFKDTVLIDLIGDPTSKTDFGTDVTFIRISSIYEPSDEFYDDEWIQMEKDNIEDLGKHSFDETYTDITQIEGSPYFSNTTSFNVTGLESGVYYYVVVALNDESDSDPSNEISVTVQASGLKETLADKIFVSGGKLVLPENNKSTTYIYNVSGMLVSKFDSTIKYVDLSNFQKGAYIIKIGNATAKIIF